MRRNLHCRRTSNESGMALVIVLLIVTLITAMVVEFAYGVYVSTNALHNWQISQKLSFAAKSATRLSSKLIQTPNLIEQYRTRAVFEISQKIPYGDLDGTMTLRIEDENAKFNLNSLRSRDDYAYKSFQRLLTQLDLNRGIADLVSFWIYADTPHRPGASVNMRSKNAYLDSVDEMLLIPGIDREAYEKLLPYVTIYGSGEGLFSININTADVPVLMCLSDSMTKDMAENIITYRQLTPFTDVSQIQNAGINLNMIRLQYLTKDGNAFHVIATAEYQGIKRIAESVLWGGMVRYWREM